MQYVNEIMFTVIRFIQLHESNYIQVTIKEKVMKDNKDDKIYNKVREIELKPYSEDCNSFCVYVDGKHIYNLLMTCHWGPEQYDLLSVYDMSKMAYFRLRHGTFTVECPDAWDEMVYRYDMEDDWAGCFESQEEREREIINALRKVVEYYEECDN